MFKILVTIKIKTTSNMTIISRMLVKHNNTKVNNSNTSITKSKKMLLYLIVHKFHKITLKALRTLEYLSKCTWKYQLQFQLKIRSQVIIPILLRESIVKANLQSVNVDTICFMNSEKFYFGDSLDSLFLLFHQNKLQVIQLN